MRPGLLLVPALLSPAITYAQSTAPQQPVAVYRGVEANVPPTIPVLRGSSAHGQPPSPNMAALESTPLAVAGERLWLIEPATGELVACRVGGTPDVGVDRIRCTRRGLP